MMIGAGAIFFLRTELTEELTPVAEAILQLPLRSTVFASRAQSLLNDAAAIALFGLFMGFVMLRMPDPDLGEELAPFPVLIFGALAG